MNPLLRRWRLAFLLAAPLALAITPLGVLDAGPTLCPIRLLFGIDCPGCGMTHAFAALLHLDFAAAFHHNPRVIIVFPLVAWAAARQVVRDCAI